MKPPEAPGRGPQEQAVDLIVDPKRVLKLPVKYCSSHKTRVYLQSEEIEIKVDGILKGTFRTVHFWSCIECETGGI